MKMKIHPVWISVHAVASVVVGLFVFVFVIHPAIAPIQARKSAKRMLSSATDKVQLQEAVGSLGLLITYTNGQWIAIRYRDSHAWPGFSSAIALDSDRRFYESRIHFCGRLSAYARIAERQKAVVEELAAQGETNTVNFLSGFADIHAVASANDLKSGIPQLLKLGFQQLDE